MEKTLLEPLTSMHHTCDTLLRESTLNELQRKFLAAIADEIRELQTLIITVPDVKWARAQEMLSYEGRSRLSSIMGYADVLLEEDDGSLSADQRAALDDVRAKGWEILVRLEDLFD